MTLSNHFLFHPTPEGITFYFYYNLALLFLHFHRDENTPYVLFCVCLLFLSIVLLKCIHVAASNNCWSSLLLRSSSLMYLSFLLLSLLTDIWVDSSLGLWVSTSFTRLLKGEPSPNSITVDWKGALLKRLRILGNSWELGNHIQEWIYLSKRIVISQHEGQHGIQHE